LKETILHFIWQHRYFAHQLLFTIDNKPINIIKQGFKNTNEGPDFEQAQIEIDGIIWNGSVEIHIKSSDWELHKHQFHKLYENVILHVVWENDKQIYYPTKEKIYTLELKNYVESNLIQKCMNLIGNQSVIPCQDSIHWVDNPVKLNMMSRVAVERLERKSQFVLNYLNTVENDWEQATYSLILKNFGFKVNSDAFARLAENLPYKIIQKHSDDLIQLEALLYGVSGFLRDEPVDSYQAQLKSEFGFLAHKYDLQPHVMYPSEWKFMRMRPGNFPTVRLSQLAVFLYKRSSIFMYLIENDLSIIVKMFHSKPSLYWQEHYYFGKESQRKLSKMGDDSINILLVNSVSVLLAAYSIYQKNELLMDKAVSVLENCKAEYNSIIKNWMELGIKATNAFESQALIELYNNFCVAKKCLSCQIGNQILKI
jgi:hypothetical protein